MVQPTLNDVRLDSDLALHCLLIAMLAATWETPPDGLLA
jgi:hypothetical protein